MPKRPSLALADEIRQRYINDDFKVVVIYGVSRMGMSVHSLRIMEEYLDA